MSNRPVGRVVGIWIAAGVVAAVGIATAVSYFTRPAPPIPAPPVDVSGARRAAD